MHHSMKDKTHCPLTPVVIIAGGNAERLNQVIKCQLRFGGTTLLSRLVYAIRAQQEQIHGQHSEIYLNINKANQDLAASCEMLGVTMLHDNPKYLQNGPLSGIFAGLDTLCIDGPNTGIITLAGDSIILPSMFYPRLHDHGVKQNTIIYCSSQHGNAYVHGFWPRHTYKALNDQLSQKHFSVGRFLRAQHAQTVFFDDEKININSQTIRIDPFFNINTPNDKIMAAQWVK